MKKAVQITVTCLMLFLLSATSIAATAATSISGPSTIRAGDTLTVAVQVSGSGLQAVMGEIQYDTSQIIYQSYSSLLSGWKADNYNLNSPGKITFLMIDDKLTAPINGTKQLFKLTFKVKETIETAAVIRITAAKLECSDGTNDFFPANASYTVKVAAPLSTNANLSSLSVSDGTMTPAFSKTTTNYALSVPFTVEKITVNAKTEDAGAKVSINSPSLLAGRTTAVTATVTAASGAKKVYTISVARAQDPNYVPSSNNNLSTLTIDTVMISPLFSKTIGEYIVYLPYEVDNLTVTATAEDVKAVVAVDGGTNLEVNELNLVTVVCTAEDGSAKTYTIVAIRAAAFTGIDSLTPALPTPTEPVPTPSPSPMPMTTATTTIKQTDSTTSPTTIETNTNNPGNSSSSSSTGIIILIALLAIIIAAETLYIIYMHSQKRSK